MCLIGSITNPVADGTVTLYVARMTLGSLSGTAAIAPAIDRRCFFPMPLQGLDRVDECFISAPDFPARSSNCNIQIIEATIIEVPRGRCGRAVETYTIRSRGCLGKFW
jgi:hypothetical protein